MNKRLLLPRLSFMGIRKNGSAYVPYLFAGMFSVFVFFVFSSILHNDIMITLPHSAYASALMGIGLFLLGFILLPFMLYTNSFLMKRRKKELGLYSILGLEKKHIAIMMVCETLMIFGAVIAGGILFGLVFSKLLFLLLLNLSGLAPDTSFTFSIKAFAETFFYFLAVYGINLIANLVQVYRSNPNDLLKGPKKGDTEPKRLWLTTLTGLVLLALGYAIAIPAKIDSSIFTDFLLAVSLVVFGTHQFFKAGLIALLKILKKSTRIYYRKSNYVTISGMLHRMKKSASSLANICVFSTMTIITLLCTLSLWLGIGGILQYRYPYDLVLNYDADKFQNAAALNDKLLEASKKTQVEMDETFDFKYLKLHVGKDGRTFKIQDSSFAYSDRYAIKLISLEDYNRIEQKQETLDDHEILIFATGMDFGYDTVILGNEEFKIKKELPEIIFKEKEVKDTFGQNFYLIVKDNTVIENLRTAYNSYQTNDHIFTKHIQLIGDDSSKEEFILRIKAWSEGQTGYVNTVNGVSGRQNLVSTNGGLLFLGIFFSIIFSMCMILIMYYKQITEGFDDRENFDIMQKVGMSDTEVRGTIKRQILMVFFLPLFIAVLHTMAGFPMVSGLLGTISLFDTGLLIRCGIVVLAIFILLYGLSYSITSRTYYRIVKQMN